MEKISYEKDGLSFEVKYSSLIEKLETMADKVITIGELELNLDKFEVKVRGNTMELTLREFEV